MIKTTKEMEQEILKADNIYDTIEANRSSLCTGKICEYIKNLLIKKNLTPARAISASGLDRSYGHQIISGKKIPSRDKLIALAFGMKLSLDETNALLKISCNRPLYARDERDAIIIYAISKGMDIVQANELLYEKDIEIIN